MGNRIDSGTKQTCIAPTARPNLAKQNREGLKMENRKLRTEVSNLTKSLKGITPHKGGGHSDRTPPRRSRKSGDAQDVFIEDRKDVSAALLN